MSNDGAKYWDFSWHEMAYFDIPAEIDFIYNYKSIITNNITGVQRINNVYTPKCFQDSLVLFMSCILSISAYTLYSRPIMCFKSEFQFHFYF